ncbi:unnamed protein product [marine sediment metagenome]|uniref:Response regulatory domain-containing protein n=1 Tax=marine sediment metagenome TaxID=412755 RepID=X1CRP6_9ZZZZ
MYPGRILLVDDESHVLELLSVALEDEGYRILTANNGRKALDQLKKEEPQVVVLDIRMPDLDGVEVLRQIKEINKATSVIMMTAYGAMDTVVKAMQLGAYDYLTKPLDLKKVKVLIRRALEAQELTREIASLRSELKERKD